MCGRGRWEVNTRLRRYVLATAGSQAKMAVGIARSLVGAPWGFSDTTYVHFRPRSFRRSSPRNWERRTAVVVAVLLRPPYSSKDLDIIVDSEM